MIDQDALGQFLNTVFMPYIPFIAGAVIATTLFLLLYLTFRDRLLNTSREEQSE